MLTINYGEMLEWDRMTYFEYTKNIAESMPKTHWDDLPSGKYELLIQLYKTEPIPNDDDDDDDYYYYLVRDDIMVIKNYAIPPPQTCKYFKHYFLIPSNQIFEDFLQHTYVVVIGGPVLNDSKNRSDIKNIDQILMNRPVVVDWNRKNKTFQYDRLTKHEECKEDPTYLNSPSFFCDCDIQIQN